MNNMDISELTNSQTTESVTDNAEGVKNWFQKKISDIDNQSSLVILHVNIRSIKKHWDLFNIYLTNFLNFLDLIVLSEINISNRECQLYNLTNFDKIMVSNPKPHSRGIIIYYREDLLIEKLSNSIEPAETIYMKIKKSATVYYVLALYRSPSTDLNTFLNELNKWLTLTCNTCNQILIGDFNINTANPNKHGVSKYLNLLSEFGFTSLIKN